MTGSVFLRKYLVTRSLDEGGMSRLFLARQLGADREVVVKLLKEELASNPKAVDHFRREMLILSRFAHPHAVAHVDSAPNDPGGPVLVMEYLKGLDLNLVLQRQGKMHPERVGRLLAQLCDVLQAAHDAGIVHRDLKPGNLMIVAPGTPQETLKLMDFGLARMKSLLYISADEIVDWRLPNAAGTPEYVCPEQVRGSEMDQRGDLYSVGVILFEMLTGRRPFAGDSIEALLDAHLEASPPTFAELGLTRVVPPALEDVVRSCLEKNPDRRPQSAGELIFRFERALGKRLLLRRSPATPQASPGAAPALAPPPRVSERSGYSHTVEVTMVEAMAMLKVKGFVHDLGGEVVDSLPGVIRVRLPEARAEPKKSGGLFNWGGSERAPALLQRVGSTDLELHMERRDPGQSNKLTITLVMRPPGGLPTVAWKDRCHKIGRDLEAYLMGR